MDAQNDGWSVQAAERQGRQSSPCSDELAGVTPDQIREEVSVSCTGVHGLPFSRSPL